MTQASLDYSAPPENMTAAVAAYFKARPGQWISALELAQVGGLLAWRTRVSECRTQLGMQIQNKTHRVGRKLHSEYRWVA